MNCPGSGVLLNELKLPETDEADYRRDGVAAHEAAAKCLLDGSDAWELMDDRKFNGVEVDQNMADAVQLYLDHVRPLMDGADQVLIEKRVGGVEHLRPHPKFYGTVDFAAVHRETRTLFVRDYKHGEGIVVEADRNVQLMYYGYGIVMSQFFSDETVVNLGIVQPRAWHEDGPIRIWETTAGDLKRWGEETLLPAMQAAEIDTTLDPGKWCRFCPAKLFCPLLIGLFGAAAKADPRAIPNFSHARIGLEYRQREAVKFYMKALEDEVYRRNSLGHTVPGTKLVNKKADRVWVAAAEKKAIELFNEEAYTTPVLKSPAQIDALGPRGKLFTKEHAYMPNTGHTVALEEDRRGAVKVEKLADTFAHMIPDSVDKVEEF
jgi:hypothetical protein